MHPEKTDSIKIKKAYRIGRFIMIPFGVAFESDDLSKEYKGNVFATPHNAYYTQESLEKMFEIWVQSMLSATDNPINKVN